MTVNRRKFLAATGATFLAGCATNFKQNAETLDINVDFRNIATKAAKFIENQATIEDNQHGWFKSPDEPSTSTEIYHGSGGVVIYMIEMFKATNDTAYLKQAMQGAEAIISQSPSEPNRLSLLLLQLLAQ
jgi:lantibiotic modifying enzyme